MTVTAFTGRTVELGRLETIFNDVRASGQGRLVALRGRRQVGKSSLVEQFCAKASAPSAYFTAARRQQPAAALGTFGEVVSQSQLPSAGTASAGFNSWEQALDIATMGVEDGAILVIDELPWLLEMDEGIEGLLQRVWDRVLRKRAVLVILIGSDLAMMDALTEYGRPLYDRVTILLVEPLTLADVADLTGLKSADAVEAWAITGGFPNLVKAWRRGQSAADYLTAQLSDPSSPFIVSGERKVTAEFPPDAFARPVLDAIGSGSREHTKIGQRSGLSGSSLERALSILIEKQAITRERAYSADTSKLTLYRVEDAHLRVWGRYAAPNMAAIERGAAGPAIQRVLADWQAWKGMAVEPIIRESVHRLALHDSLLSATAHVGRWWRRDGKAEVDLVLGDRLPVANTVLAVGSIKWRQHGAFSSSDVRELSIAAAHIPGADGAPLVAVSRVPGAVDGLERLWTPDHLVAAWH
jgi:uncharacterized protein